MISRFFQNFPGKSQVSLCINVTYSNALTMKGTIVIWDYVRGELAVTFKEQAWRILKNLA